MLNFHECDTFVFRAGVVRLDNFFPATTMVIDIVLPSMHKNQIQVRLSQKGLYTTWRKLEDLGPLQHPLSM